MMPVEMYTEFYDIPEGILLEPENDFKVTGRLKLCGYWPKAAWPDAMQYAKDREEMLMSSGLWGAVCTGLEKEEPAVAVVFKSRRTWTSTVLKYDEQGNEIIEKPMAEISSNILNITPGKSLTKETHVYPPLESCTIGTASRNSHLALAQLFGVKDISVLPRYVRINLPRNPDGFYAVARGIGDISDAHPLDLFAMFRPSSIEYGFWTVKYS